MKYKAKRKGKDEWVEGVPVKSVIDTYFEQWIMVISITFDELDYYWPMVDYEEIDIETLEKIED